MSFNYTIQLEIANEKERNKFDLTKIKDHINSAIDDYHNLNTVRNKKELSCKITSKILEMHIKSPVKLNTPSKAIAKFTRLLLERSSELRSIVSNGRVFQSVETRLSPDDIDEISNVETLKRLVEIFCKENDKKKEPNENIRESNKLLILQRNIKKIVFDISE